VVNTGAGDADDDTTGGAGAAEVVKTGAGDADDDVTGGAGAADNEGPWGVDAGAGSSVV
jgi:hypothetical protein